MTGGQYDNTCGDIDCKDNDPAIYFGAFELNNKECQTGQWEESQCAPITSCVTDSNGKCELNSYAGRYAIVLEYPSPDGMVYVADVGVPVLCGKETESKLYLITSPTGEIMPANTAPLTGGR